MINKNLKVNILLLLIVLTQFSCDRNKETNNVVTLNLKDMEARFTVVDDDIIRFQYYNKGADLQKDPHLEEIAKDIAWNFSKTDSGVVIRTKKVELKYNTVQNSISYYDATTKQLILSESNSGKIQKPISRYGEDTISVAQRFLSPKGEVLSGLGFHNQDFINYRGAYVYLCQDNTVSAIPFLVSSNNYGILWNNASVTEFNPNIKLISQVVDKKDSTLTEGNFLAKESGQYCFIMKREIHQQFKNEIILSINDSLVYKKHAAWDGAHYNVKINLTKGDTYKLSSKGGYKLYYLTPTDGNEFTFSSELADGIDYHFVYGKNIDGVIDSYRQLTGQAPMMPKWALGFFQSKERYHTDDELLGILKEYREKNYPLDVIFQDWEYWGKHGWNAMRFDTTRFKDAAATFKSIHDLNAKVMISVWPNFGDPKEGSQERLSQFDSLGFLSKRTPITAADAPDGGVIKYYNGYYDVMNPKARSLYWNMLDTVMFDKGIDAWWLDATEAKINGIQGGWRYCSTIEGPAAYWTNIYPLMHSKGVYEGQRSNSDEKRVFILGRTAYTGIQKYASAVWTGDAYTTWQVYNFQIANGISASYSGLPYHTNDIGGFAGLNNQDLDHRELYTRWFQFGTFCPIFRSHGTSSAREVWRFGEESEKIQVDYIRLRYRLLPYIYSLSGDVTLNNGTIIRGLMMDFPEDKKAISIADQYMFGKSMLVAPVTKRLSEGGNKTRVYLPKGNDWYDFWTGEKHLGGKEVIKNTPLNTIPLYVKGGSIIPMGPLKQYATEKAEDPIELRVYTGADASFMLYEDENDNYNYEKGAFSTILFEWNEESQVLTIHKRKGEFKGMLKKRKINIVWVNKDHGIGAVLPRNIDREVVYNGETISFKK